MDRSMERLPVIERAGQMLIAELMGTALVRARPSEMPALRRRPGPVPEGWTRTPASLLRYSDEQTVVATASVFAAIAAMASRPDPFEAWGVVAASRYLGRANLAAALRSFKAEGVWGTSPHLIPHFALHSPSGTISLALGLRGPNVGVGGGLHAVADGFLAAMTWLSAGVVPGVWLVLSGWTPELIPERRGLTNSPAPAVGEASGDAEIECRALALALRPAGSDPAAIRRRFRVVIGGDSASVPASVDLVGLARDLETPGGLASRTIATDAAGGLRVELVEGPEGPG
jgi:hypothetical protein